MQLDHLVNGIAELLGVREAVRHEGDDGQPAHLEFAGDTDVESEAVRSIALTGQIHAIWDEVRLLPLNQRRALLLHLERDELRAFVRHGCCSSQQLAQALDMEGEEFRECFRHLPIPDRCTADRLGVTVRQVINLRKCARERLSRRLKGLHEA